MPCRKKKYFSTKLPFPPHKRAITDLAGYLAIGWLRPSFDFHHLIKSFALRAW